MIDVVYKVNNREKWSYEKEELRYSIRSVVENFTELNKIIIVGYKPNWLKNVIHIDVEDKKDLSKDANIIKKLYAACENDLVTGSFINISDDQIINNTVTTEDFVNYVNNEYFKQAKDFRFLSAWAYSLFNTVSILKAKKLPVNCYETHTPKIINKSKFKQIIDKYKNYCYKYYGLCANTLYFNQIKAGAKEIDDSCIFLKDKIRTEDQIIEALDDKNFIGYNPNATNEVLKDYLRQKYDKPTIFEEN